MTQAAATAAYRDDPAKGVPLVALATVFWSFAGFFVRLVPTLDGWQINCWRGLSMSIALALWLIAAHGRHVFQRIREVPVQALLVCGLFFAFGSTLYVTALTLTATVNVSCISALAPIITAMLAGLVIGERTGASSWIAAVLALIGVGVIMWDGLEAGSWLGSAAAVAVAFSFSVQTLMLRRYAGYDLVPAICFGGFLLFLVAALFAGGLHVPPREIAILSVMGPVQLGLPLVLYARGARYSSAVMLNLVAMLDVVVNPGLSYLVTGERPPAATYLGGGIIVAAILICVLGVRRR